MAVKSKCIGVMRFSVLTPTYYSERFDGIDAIAEHLFAPDRMALRFRIFERLVLPSLLNQSDDGFDLAILTAERMPQEYKDRMRELLKDAPHIRFEPVGTDNHYQLLKNGYNLIDPKDATHRILFRLDDDDAMDRNYIRRMKWICRNLHKIHPKDATYALAFNKGFYVRTQPGEQNEVFDATERAPLSTGTALLAPVGYHRNPYRYNHRALGQHYNLYSDISVPAFIRTIHGDNKSTPTQMGSTHRLKPKMIDKQLRQHFGVTLDEMKTL
ncbi:MAG: glycosyltransferase [Aliishimia sp.]